VAAEVGVIPPTRKYSLLYREPVAGGLVAGRRLS